MYDKYLILAILLVFIPAVVYLYIKVKDLYFENKVLNQKKRHLFLYCKELQTQLYKHNIFTPKENHKDTLTKLYNLNGFVNCSDDELHYLTNNSSYYVVCFDLVGYRKENLSDMDIINFSNKLKQELLPATPIARYDYYKFVIGFNLNQEVLQHMLSILYNILAEGMLDNLKPNFGIANYPVDIQEKNSANLIALAEQRLHMQRKNMYKSQLDNNKQMRYLSAAGELAATLVHEIRNPLASIRGFVQMLTQEGNDKCKKLGKVILPEIDRINGLLTQFLHLGKSRYTKFKRFNLNALIKDVIALLDAEAHTKNCLIEANAPDYFVILEADPEQLKQVFINLIKNALQSFEDKTSKGAENRILISWKEERLVVNILVKDNGPGISFENSRRIFDPFFTTKTEGTGMGLAICKHIIDEHSGEITCKSQVGEGTTFDIKLLTRQKKARPSSKRRNNSEIFADAAI